MRNVPIAAVLCGFALASLPAPGVAQKDKKPAPAEAAIRDGFGDPLPKDAIARIGTRRFRIPEGRNPESSVLSPDGKFLAVLGLDNDLEIWELPAWVKQKVIRGRDLDKKLAPQFQHLTFGADSNTIAVADMTRVQILLIDWAKGTVVKKLGIGKAGNIQGMHRPIFSGDGKILLSGVQVQRPNGQVMEFKTWDLEKDKVLHTMEIPPSRFDGTTPPVALSQDGKWLIQIGTGENPNSPRPEGFLEIWNLTTGKSAHKIDLDVPVRFLAASPRNRWLALSDGLSYLRIYDQETAKEVHHLRLKRTSLSHMEFLPNGDDLLIAEHGAGISQWNAAKGEKVAQFPAPVSRGARQFVFLPGGTIRAMTTEFESVHYWDVKSGKAISPTGVPTGYIDEVRFVPNGELFVASEDGVSAWWNAQTGTKIRDLNFELHDHRNLIDGIGRLNLRSFNPGVPGDFLGGRGNVSLSRDGHFATISDGNILGIFDAKTGKLLYDELNGNGQQGHFAPFEMGQRMLSIAKSKGRIWDARTGRDLDRFTVPIRALEVTTNLAASAKATWIAYSTVSSNGDLTQSRTVLWDRTQKKILREWNHQGARELLRFSPDDQWLAVGAPGGNLRLIRVANPRGDHALAPDGFDLNEIEFSPDGRLLACACLVAQETNELERIVLYEMASKKIRREFAGHATMVHRLSLSHDNKYLATGAGDTTALVWKAGLAAYAEPRAAKEAQAEDLADWFEHLANEDAKAAFDHMIHFVRTPRQATRFLAEKIAPARAPDTGGKPIAQWIRELGSTNFALRNRANATLQKLGTAVEPDLRESVARAPDVETKRRIEELLDRIASQQLTTEELRDSRAVEVLEAIGTAEARTVLTRWSGGHPGAVLTRESRTALTRLR